MQLQFAHDIRAVGFRRLYAESQRHPTSFVLLAFGQQLHNFALARCETISPPVTPQTEWVPPFQISSSTMAATLEVK